MQDLIKSVQKISDFIDTKNELSSIEKDLLLGYTRDFYEEILRVKPSQNFLVAIEEREAIKVSVKNEELEQLDIVADTIVNEEVEIKEDIANNDEDPSEIAEEQNEAQEKILFNLADVENEPFLLEPELNKEDDKIELAFSKPIVAEPLLKNEVPLQKGQNPEFKLWNRDIKKYIGINDKYNFISELFGNNAEAYDALLNEINLCESKESAIKLLTESGASTLYRWKEDGESEQVFYNVLSQFFSAK